MAIVGYRFSRVTIAAVFVLLSVIALITGCRIFSVDDDEVYYPQVTATSMSGRILVPADLAGYVDVAGAEVWIEDLADNLKYHRRTNASGVYVINDVPPGPHRVVARLENGGLGVMKNRSAEINVSETPGVVPVPDMPLLVAKNIVAGQLRDADGNFLPENTILSLWGETFKVGKDGTFTSPPLPKDFSSAEIQVQLPNGNGVTTFSAPFVSDIVPVVVDLMVGGSQETGNHAPSVILQATQAGEISSKVSPGSSLVLTAVGSDLDESDRTMLSVTWEVTAGTLITASSDFEKTWKAPDYQTLATITVEVKDPKGAVGVARLPILVGIDNPSQYDGARPSVTLSSEVTQVADSAAFVVGISFDELVSGFALEDISVTNGTADNFSTVTAGRNYSVQVKPQTAGAVTVAVGENLARDVAGNGNRAANVLTVTNNVAPVLSSAKVLTAFAFSNPDVNCSIDEDNKTVTVTLPFGTDASALVANFTVSAKASVKVGAVDQVSGTTVNNFTAPVVYQIIAEDGSIAEYTVTVTVTQPVLVTALDLSSLVTAPVKGAAPVTAAIDQTQYSSGAISWFEADGTTAVTGNFAAAKVYVAELTLTAKAGYTLTGVAENSFSFTGATSVANAANSGNITITFGATDATIINIAAVPGVTAPVTGATPVTNITETAQYTGTVSWSPDYGTFAADTVYTATVNLTPKAGFTLAGVGANFFTVAGATATNGANSGAISAVFGGTDVTVDIAAVAGVTAPVTGATPVTTITETAQYTGTVSWSPAHGTFAADTVYTATVTLAPKTGFTLAGVGANFFTVAGATATNGANSGTISAVFGGTDATVDIAAVAGVTAPVTGATPVTTITETAQYTGTVSWSPAHGTFAADTVYTATVTLAPKTGFTLAGVGANFFTVAGATATNGANSGAISAVFGGTDVTVDIAAVAGVTAPVTGATPVTTITETAQYTGTVSWSPAHGTFAADTVYTATVTLAPKTGFTLAGVGANFFTVAGATATNGANSGTISAVFGGTDATVDIAAVAGVTAPVTGATPVTTITETAQYTGTVSWSPAHGTFAADTVYTATVTLAPKTGFTLAGVGANFFTVAGATATNGANSGTVSAVFGGTDVTVDIAAVAGVTAPVTGATPVTTITETAQYTGTVSWSPAHGTFAADTVYTATVTLAPKAGFTLAGVGANFFTVAGATATNGANSGTVSAVFGGTDVTVDIAAVAGVTAPVTGATPITTVTETAQYTGTVSWLPAHVTFAADTVYTATVTLAPKAGFTLAGVGANFFTVAGATATNGANSGAISAVFGGTDATINIAAVAGVTAPVTGATPVTAITETAQYTGTVSWSPAHGTFAADTVYTATVTLTPKAGFTLAGVGANFFTVAGATATNGANSGTVSAVFGGTDVTVDIAAVAGVTAPVTGATPITTVTETAQYTGTVSWLPAHVTFAADTVYTATVTLAPKAGFTLAGVGANFFTVAGATATNGANSGAISAVFGGTDATINIAAVAGVTAPVTGATPVTAITETAQYTGTVSWSPAHGTFAADTVYTATVTLTPKAGFTLAGVGANFFTVAGATATNGANSGTVSAVFGGTDATVDIAAVAGVAAPVTGATPVTTITETAQYTGTVSWSPVHGTFAAGTVYTATVTLTPKAGFTLVGVAENFFTVSGATATNGANSGTISAVFGGTAATVDIAAVAGVTEPVTGAAPVTTITETAQYTGTVSWSPVHGTFAAGTVYTATVTLTPKAGFTLVGVAENFFTAAGGASTNAANSGSVSIIFAATTEPITAIGEVSGVPMDGQTLTAGAVTPGAATVDYRWQVSNDGVNGWSDISGANSSTYEVVLAKSAVGQYVRVVATGNGSYGGEVFSAAEKIQGMPTMVSVPAGTFHRDANAAHTSFVSAFSMSAHEITREQFLAIMGTDPSDTDYSNGDADPVQKANWYHAIAFCNKLSLAEGLTPVYAVSGVDFSTLTYADIPTSRKSNWDAATCNWSANAYRLPTEMEWMWAAMGADSDAPGATNTTGYLKAFAGSTGSNLLGDYAWYSANSSSKTHPVGTTWANELGLYDMSGNVWEWCWDWYDSYPANSNSDYRGAGTGSNRVIRGGSWNNSADDATVANRYNFRPGNRYSDFGFRVVRSVITPLTAIGSVSGTPKSGQTLTAGALTPGYAAVNYQWQVSDNGSSGWSNIDGETANTYVVNLTKTAVGKYVRVTATGKDSYSGTVYSSALNIWGDYTSANIGTLKYVPAGTFQRDATPANTSAVSGFRMAQHEVTRTQFSTIMGTDPTNTAYSNGNADPVQKANWYHAIAFCNKLSLAEGLTPVYAVTGVDFSTLTYVDIPTTSSPAWNAATCDWSANGYRLPTQMEWMWAAMGAPADGQGGGTNATGYAKTFAGSDGSNSIDDYAWYSTNSDKKTHPAGTKLANELGLYDMSGNVWEWCWDWYDSYPANSNSDYRGAGTGSYRVVRGGSWINSADNLTVAYRSNYSPYSQNRHVGIRVVRP